MRSLSLTKTTQRSRSGASVMSAAPTSDEQALDALMRAGDARILVIGDVMLDRFLYGSVERISPEGPIPVFTLERESRMLGGAGNVVRNLLSLGAQATFLSVIGDDTVGKQLLGLVEKEQRLVPYLFTEKDRVSTKKTRYVAAGQQLLRADHETPHPVSAATEAQLVALIESEVSQHQAVILSDYGKGVLTPAIVSAAINAARSAGVFVLVDPKRRDLSLYKGATLISPNAKEFLLATGREHYDPAQADKDAHALITALALDALLVTRGREGMRLTLQDGTQHSIAAEARDVFDVSGAGDTAIATLAVGMACGLPMPVAARIANLAAGIVVGRLGTAVVHHSDLTTAIHQQQSLALTHKILPLAVARDQITNWKREGLKVGFTNGCFDIMHAGHVTLLNDAKARCDRLIVAINADSSVARLKGPSRPVNAEHDRALLLAAIGSVDAVVIFEEDTPLTLLEQLKPDVLMKGADYTKETVVGAALVESYGGHIELLPLKQGYSTTGIIARAGSQVNA